MAHTVGQLPSVQDDPFARSKQFTTQECWTGSIIFHPFEKRGY